MHVRDRGRTMTGVSTSSAPVARNSSRARASSAAAGAARRATPSAASRRGSSAHSTRRAPGRAAARARAEPLGEAPGALPSNSTTVEPMLKRPSSSPRVNCCRCPSRCCARRRRARRRVDFTSEDGFDAAHEQRAHQHHCERPGPVSNSQTTRSLRANRPGIVRAVAALTLNSRPGT